MLGGGQGAAPPIRVFLADDVTDMRALVRFALDEDDDIVVVGEAATGRDTVTGAEESHADVVLLDLAMPDVSGMEALPLLRGRLPNIGIVVYSGMEAARLRGPALAGGADRYVEKGRPLDEVRAAIREVAVLTRSRAQAG